VSESSVCWSSRVKQASECVSSLQPCITSMHVQFDFFMFMNDDPFYSKYSVVMSCTNDVIMIFRSHFFIFDPMILPKFLI
jgi:hypothetical protein